MQVENVWETCPWSNCDEDSVDEFYPYCSFECEHKAELAFDPEYDPRL